MCRMCVCDNFIMLPVGAGGLVAVKYLTCFVFLRIRESHLEEESSSKKKTWMAAP